MFFNILPLRTVSYKEEMVLDNSNGVLTIMLFFNETRIKCCEQKETFMEQRI